MWIQPSARETCPAPADIIRGATGPLADVRYLADDGLHGRLAGSDGERCAGDYIAGEFGKVRLRPAGDNGTFFQSLSLASALNPHAAGGTGRNVIAALDGMDARLKDEWIVIGAHYDHLGEGGSQSSLAPGNAAIHNGADDNASGVSVDALGRRAFAAGRVRREACSSSRSPAKSPACSAPHTSSPIRRSTGRMTAMINLDMVGRLGAGPLIVYGVDTADEWRAVCRSGGGARGDRDRHAWRRLRTERSHIVLHEGHPGPAPVHEHAR